MVCSCLGSCRAHPAAAGTRCAGHPQMSAFLPVTSSDACSFAGEYEEMGSLPEALQHEFCHENTYVHEKVKDVSLGYCLLMSSHVGGTITS